MFHKLPNAPLNPHMMLAEDGTRPAYYIRTYLDPASTKIPSFSGDLVEEGIPGENEGDKSDRIRYNYGIVVESDATEVKQREMVSTVEAIES